MEGYEFQQHVPHDVDFRILLTFLELYRTLISFVLYKLYTEENLVYPPPMDKEADEAGENVGALKLVERKDAPAGAQGASKMSKKEVKRAIKIVNATGATVEEDVEMDEEPAEEETEEEFVERPSNAVNEDVATAPLTTYSQLASTSEPTSSKHLIFAPYTFYLSRETSSKTWEFVVRAMGGKVVTSLTAPSPDATPLADQITHVIIDRPVTPERMREMQGGRKWTWIQPQWVADCVNRFKILGAEEYAPGKLLPPHLSPWEGEGELNRPWLEENADGVRGVDGVDGEAVEIEAEEDEEEDDDDDDEEDEEDGDKEDTLPPALLAAAQNPSDPTLLHAAELEAERNGVSHTAFTAQLKAATKANASSKPNTATKGGEEDLRKIMMSNKKAKLYEKMQYSNKNKQAEKEKLEAKRQAIEKRKRKEARGRA